MHITSGFITNIFVQYLTPAELSHRFTTSYASMTQRSLCRACAFDLRSFPRPIIVWISWTTIFWALRCLRLVHVFNVASPFLAWNTYLCNSLVGLPASASLQPVAFVLSYPLRCILLNCFHLALTLSCLTYCLRPTSLIFRRCHLLRSLRSTISSMIWRETLKMIISKRGHLGSILLILLSIIHEIINWMFDFVLTRFCNRQSLWSLTWILVSWWRKKGWFWWWVRWMVFN